MKLTPEGIAVIEGDNYLSADIIAQGRLDVARDYLMQFKQYIPEGGVVVDVGACLGDFTATFSEFVGPEGWVHAFEPNPIVVECLLYNTRKLNKVLVHPFALGDCHLYTSLMLDYHNIGASYLTGTVPEGSIGSVQVVPLDDYNLTRMDFIKIDAEGYEPWVLKGAAQTIQRLRPTLLVEIDQRALGFQGLTPKAVHMKLDELGYDFPRFDGAHGNILCLPKEKV